MILPGLKFLLTNTFYNYFGLFTSFFCLLPLLIGFINFRRISADLKPVLLLLIFILLTEIVSSLISDSGINTFPVIRIYTVIEFCCLFAFYKRFFDAHTKIKFLKIVIPVFFLIALTDAFVLNSINSSDTLASSIEGVSIIIFSVNAFYLIMKKMLFDNLLDEPFFWINSAYLIYFSGTLFLFIFLNYIVKNQIENYGKLYIINSILNLVNYTLITIGFWKTRKA